MMMMEMMMMMMDDEMMMMMMMMVTPSLKSTILLRSVVGSCLPLHNFQGSFE